MKFFQIYKRLKNNTLHTNDKNFLIFFIKIFAQFNFLY